MSDARKVLSPLKASPPSGSQCSSCKGRDMPPGLLGAFLLLNLWGCDSRQWCTPSVVHPASGQSSPKGPKVRLLAWHRALLSESPGNRISAVDPSGQRLQGLQGGFLGSTISPGTPASRQELHLPSTEYRRLRNRASPPAQPKAAFVA